MRRPGVNRERVNPYIDRGLDDPEYTELDSRDDGMFIGAGHVPERSDHIATVSGGFAYGPWVNTTIHRPGDQRIGLCRCGHSDSAHTNRSGACKARWFTRIEGATVPPFAEAHSCDCETFAP